MTRPPRYTLVRCDADDAELFEYADHNIFQTNAWLAFLAQTQRGEVVTAHVRDGERTVGRFTGLLVRRYGVRILGSPLPGWTTAYMGLNMQPGASRAAACRAVRDFAFDEVGCWHLEMTDRYATRDDLASAGYKLEPRRMSGYELDLTPALDDVFAAMKSSTRRNVRKAERVGVTVEVADDAGFADEYYAQLRDVFARQRLTPTYGIERVRALIAHLAGTGRLLLLRARNAHGTSIATGIFPALNGTMYFWGGASLRQHQILRPNDAIQWFAMDYWRRRGVRTYDMMGGGRYKRNYGAYPIHVPRARVSRYAVLERLRAWRQGAQRLEQRLRGRLGR